MSDLSGQVALVTGASRGIGAATAEALAAAGAHVILTARDARLLETVEQRIFDAGGAATIAPMDLSEPDAIARLAAALSERWPALDILVHAAAILPQLGPVQDIDDKAFARALTTNAQAVQTLIARFDPLLRKSGDGRFVFLTSSVATDPRAFWGAYAASKAAGEVLAMAYAHEQANIGRVRVAIVDPGATRTDMRAKAYPGEDPQTLKPAGTVGDAIAALVGEAFVSPHRLRVNQSA